MGYTSDGMKKQYRKLYDKQRSENLIRLREEIAGLTQAKFQTEIGFTKSDLSCLESGDKLLSLFHIQAYKCFFKEKFNIDISVDYLMGYTTIIANDNMETEKTYGLSDTSIIALKVLNKISNKKWEVIEKGYNFENIGASPNYIDVINYILSRDILLLTEFLNNIYTHIHINEFSKIKAISDDMEFIVDKAFLARETSNGDEIIEIDKIAKAAIRNATYESINTLLESDKEHYSFNSNGEIILAPKKE